MPKPVHLILSRDRNAGGRRRLFEDSLAARAMGLPIAGLWVAGDVLDLPEDDAAWSSWRDLDATLVVLTWQNARPVRWLFARHGIELNESQVVDLRTIERPDDIARRLPIDNADDSALPPVRHDLDPPAAERWFPVVDYSRCVHCAQCLQYCLFGVYDTDDGHLRVANPDRCKPGCPACARVCPKGAIMFPRCPDGAIAGADGAEPPTPADAKTLARLRDRHIEGSNKKANADRPGDEPDEPDDLDILIDDLERLT